MIAFGLQVACLLFLLSSVSGLRPKNSIVMTFIARDEAVNIKSNLPLWAEVIDYFVFMIDERTTDGTESAIADVLDGRTPYEIVYHNFTGFGPARTKSLRNAWKFFPQASHVWIADPDWKPDLSTINKDDLTLEHDAFRFLIYDRNGITTRRCDWLLRHREGLAMRYHLHEVLDIGETYIPYRIPWIVHEIEQKGSWHTTVGHGHSMSAQRYIFDLQLLQKDLEMYGHDPHTHHYLGVSHEAYVEKMLQSNGNILTEELRGHLDESIKYLTLRVTGVYKTEFLEERWACMYALAGIYVSYLRDDVSGLRWLQACHEFSPQQTECALGMLHIYESQGRLEESQNMLLEILRTEHEERTMLNHFKHWSCDVPVTASRVLVHVAKYSDTGFTKDDAKYLKLLAGVASSEECVSYGASLGPETASEVLTVLQPYDLASSPLSNTKGLCNDRSLVEYIIRNEYTLHPCENIKHEATARRTCKDFTQMLPSPAEDRQVYAAKEFIGAASIYDIAHHAYAGFARRITHNPYNRGYYRILFAEHFNFRNLLYLIGFAHGNNLEHKLQITVLTSQSELKQALKQRVELCLHKSLILDHVTFIDLRNGQRFSDALRGDADGSTDNYYDYVEYNGGMSLSSEYSQHLNDLKTLIGSRGVIGITYYTKNIVQESLRRVVQQRNMTAHIPLSDNPINLVKGYLKAHDLVDYTKDAGLVAALADGECVSYSKSDVESIVQGLNFKILSWIPTARMSPYDMIPDEMVQRYKSYGMLEEDFMNTISSQFRATVYVSRSDSQNPGRAISTEHMLNNTKLIARSANLGYVFSSAVDKAQSRLSMSYGIPLSARRKTEFMLRVVCLPYSMAALSLLSDSPSFQKMLEFNAQITPEFSPFTIKYELLKSLGTLEKFNFITLWTPEDGDSKPPLQDDQKTTSRKFSVSRRTPAPAPPPPSDKRESQLLKSGLKTAKRSPTLATENRGIHKSASVEEGVQSGDEGVVNVGGLKFSRRPPSEKSSIVDDKTQTGSNEVPAICRIPGVSGGGICSAFKKQGVADEETTQRLYQKKSEGEELQSGSVATGPVSDSFSKRVAALKKMGFSDAMVSKIIQKDMEADGDILSPEQSSGTTASVHESVSGSQVSQAGVPPSPLNEAKDVDDDIPAVCRIPGVNGGNVCKPYLDKQKKRNEIEDFEPKQVQASTVHKGPNPLKDSHGEYDVQVRGLKKLGLSDAVIAQILSKASVANADSGIETSEGRNIERNRVRTGKEYQPQSREMLLKSYRNPTCEQFADSVAEKEHCTMPTTLKRPTSGNTLTSKLKVTFDLKQLAYLYNKKAIREKFLIENAVHGLENLLDTLRSSGLQRSSSSVMSLNSHQRDMVSSIFNRAVYVAEDTHLAVYAEPGALDYIKSVVRGIDSVDFFVIDGVLVSEALSQLADLLLSSTIWFDVANGFAFAAHSDDGLAQSSFHELGQAFESVISPSDSNSYHLKKYYAVALDGSAEGVSSLSMGEPEDIHVIVWLNGETSDAIDDSQDNEHDGLVVLSVDYTACLQNHGMRVNERTHPDFASRMGSLNAGLTKFCPLHSSETIPQKSNRVTILAPGRSHLFKSVGSYSQDGSFDENIILALVYVFSPDESG
mmetsp:Transcript_25503/g.37637  ORF Transcript_25503/g.37637 Transcript_25503/m.37637 type:complete len:1617 (-) Transcript_25503:131-4981(-)